MTSELLVDRSCDVLVVGGGGAGICAALAAREAGARVRLLEWATRDRRGGNTYFTAGSYRFPYDGTNDLRTLVPDLTDAEAEAIDVGRYSASQFYDDIMRVTEDLADPLLADLVVERAFPTIQWIQQAGVRFVPAYSRQAFNVAGTQRFWGGMIIEAVGGGAELSDRLFARAAQIGVDVQYGCRAVELIQDARGGIGGVIARSPDGVERWEAKAVVLAAGGFEANAAWRSQYLGAGWELAPVRGNELNVGDGIRMALNAGAQPWGHWSGCHATPWDLNAPAFGDRVRGTPAFQRLSYPYGIMVNVRGERFLDEAADYHNYTYAKYGREILRQPRRTAIQIFDGKVAGLLREEYKAPRALKAETDTIGELAVRLNGLGVAIDRAALEETIAQFNQSVQPGAFNPSVLDAKHTQGLPIQKSNWAQPIDTPPYRAFVVTCGITFTFGGLRVNTDAQVLMPGGDPIPGLFAAGELVGGLFYHNYPGGTGLMAGAVFGRIAGVNAAQQPFTDRRSSSGTAAQPTV